ncbi:MAG: DUF445 domain-containing protein [Acidimicrobiales bacterium]
MGTVPSSAPRVRDTAAADETRRAGLRRMKLIAAGVLVAAAVIYLATLDRGGWVGFVNAAAEAAMIGALADWFAVTALFRHPLGIRIPHTAIIPTRKRQLGRSLQEFVTDNFLAEDVVRERVGRAQVGARLGEWLSRREHAERVGAELARVTSHGLRRLSDEDAALIMEHAVLRPLASRPWSPSAGRLLQQLVTEGSHRRLVDLVAAQLHHWLRTNDDRVLSMVANRTPGWMPRWADDRISARVYQEIVRFVDEVRRDPDHAFRHSLDDVLLQFAGDLQHDPTTMHRVERMAQRVIAHPDLREALDDVWAHLRTVLIDAADDPGSELRLRGVDALVQSGERLRDDPEARARFDARAQDISAFAVRSYGEERTAVITETVDRWDGRDAARRVELHVGRDLQFIRINGTIVGGLAGLLIHAVTVWIV